jgi:ABC-type branched-subunit amino acid transport system substrate-binding protein
VLLAKDQVNEDGGRQVELIVRGRTGQWGADGVEAARMVTDDGVEGLIAPPDGAACHLTLQVSGRTAVPVVNLCSDASVGRTGVPWVLRVVPRTADEVQALLEGLSTGVSGKTNRWTAIVPDERPGREVSRDLSQAARIYGVTFEKLSELSVTLTNADFVREQVLRSRPDVILLWLPAASAGKMAKAIRRTGWPGVLAGPGRLQSMDFRAAAGPAFEGFIIPGIIMKNESLQRWDSFRVSYQAVWHHQPDLTAGMGFDAAMLLVHLLQRPEFQAPPHRLPPDFSWQGVTGDLSFDSEGNRRLKLELLRGHAQGFIAAKTEFSRSRY